MGRFSELLSSLPDGIGWCNNTLLKKLGDLLDSDRAILAKTSGNEIPSGTGRAFHIQPGGSSTGGAFPFQITNATTDATPKVKVSLDSWLMLSRNVSDRMAITGLGSPLTISADKFITLTVHFSGGEPDTATISLENPFDQLIVYDDPGSPNREQTDARRVIGYVFASDDSRLADYTPAFTAGSLTVVQALRTNLLLCEVCDLNYTTNSMFLEDYSHTAYIPA